jgi:hypothetical protein
MKNNQEIEPPWVKYPDYPPGDGFWRQAGEPWFALVWRPYWESLNAQEQDDYLNRWNVPQIWRLFYFDRDFREWLRLTDSE